MNVAASTALASGRQASSRSPDMPAATKIAPAFPPTSMSLQWANASVTKPLAAASRDISAVPSAETRTTTASNRTEGPPSILRSEEHTSELQTLMRYSYGGLCLKKQTSTTIQS